MNCKQSLNVWFVLAAIAVIATLLAAGQLMPVARAQAETPTPEPPPAATRVRETDGAVMVYVPAGEFLMGSLQGAGDYDEFPQHTVHLDGFWIDRTEVTNAQYRQCIDARACKQPACLTLSDFDAPEQPLVCVTWDKARDFCRWAGARLPTEAEWEKAARGTDGRTYPWGDDFDGSRLNYCDRNCELADRDTVVDDGYRWPAPVGSYPSGASPYGAWDMAGNVWEWVADWYEEGYDEGSTESNPLGPDTGDKRAVRGGSWQRSAHEVRSACRGKLPPYATLDELGFRCAVSEPQAATPAPAAAFPPPGTALYGIWGSSATDIFVVGGNGTILHYDGKAWSPMASGTTRELSTVWGSSPNDVFAVGEGATILHYDGKAWTAMPSEVSDVIFLVNVWGSSASDVFAVGCGGTILHYDGSAWSTMQDGEAYCLYGAWGSSGKDVFAAGDRGRILHYDGSAWSAMTSGATEVIYGVWGTSARDVFALGEGGLLLHYDGRVWRAVESVTGYPLVVAWGSSDKEVFAVGDAGTILHYDGKAWTPMTSGTTNNLQCVWGSSGSDMYAVGQHLTLLHYDGKAWSPMSWQ